MLREAALSIGMIVAANGADLAATRHALGRGGVEMNPILGPRGERLVAVKVAATAAETWVYLKLKKRHRRAARVVVLVVVAVNVGAAVHNHRQMRR